MQKEIPRFDLPIDYIIMDDITDELLNQYGRFPCKIKAELFVLCTKGRIRATINLSEYTIQANDFVTLLPDSFIQIHEASPDIKLYVAGFSSGFVSNFNTIVTVRCFYSIILGNPVISLSPSSVPVYAGIYVSFIASYKSFFMSLNGNIIKAILLLFTEAICEIYRLHKEEINIPSSHEYQIYQRFLLVVMEQYQKEHSISHYAQKLNLSVPYLSGCVRKAVGHTASEVISAVVIMDAKTQLKSTDCPINKIAVSLGFENVAFFSKFFKRHTSMTPKEYRNS